jgi:2-polyprenyl-3-methyl-5-hydroxy-6-metoxy-1,4-benzoquinol methylase
VWTTGYESDKVLCKRKFDVVLALEVVEHVSDLSVFFVIT